MLGTVVVVIGAAAQASAHARLLGTDPAAAATVRLAPTAVRLSFSEVIEAAQSQVLVTDPDRQPLIGTHTSGNPRDGRALITTLPPRLSKGTYTVSWRVLSLDGHPVAGTFRFAMGSSTSALTATTSGGFGPTVLGGTGRALDDVGLLTLVGLSSFPLVMRRGVSLPGRPCLTAETVRQVRHRLRPFLLAACALAIVGNALLVVDTAAQAGGFTPLGVGRHLDAVSGLLIHTRSGLLIDVREATLVLLGGAWVGRVGQRWLRRWGTHTEVAATLLALATVSLASHASTASADTALSVAIDWTHLAAAGVWTGGLLALAVAGLPTARVAAERDPVSGAEQAAALTGAFSDLAQRCMLVVLVTGSYTTLVHVTDLGQLSRTAWGVELVAKLALWATALLLATVSTVSLVPRISRRAAGASARLAACGDLATAARYELAAAAALITVAAVLAGTAAPDQLT